MEARGYAIPDEALDRVMGYIDDPRDRDAISLVCKKWHKIDAATRKHITIALCYSTTPARLTGRFPALESLRLKGKPRAAMFNLIPEDWGGYAGPWIAEIAAAFRCLKDIHFKRMIVYDEDLDVLVRARGQILVALGLNHCSGFSTNALRTIARNCRRLKTLFLEESDIKEYNGQWLHDLAVHNTVLENLNFYKTELIKVSCTDLELMAKNCKSLLSLQISDSDVSNLLNFFRTAEQLEGFCGGSFDDQIRDSETYKLTLPPRLCRLGLNYMRTKEIKTIFPIAAALNKLDLQFTFLSTEDHCQLIQKCPNLEILEVRSVIGDSGLEVVAQHCKRLKRLRIERGEDEYGVEDERGKVSQRGLSILAQGCLELEYLAVYVWDISNSALEALGEYSKNLCDFRLVLLEWEERITDLPLDNGVRALLVGCTKLKRFALYLRQGGLTDIGLGYLGRYSTNIRWMLLGYVGESDHGLLQFAAGCPSLQKLELRCCCFTERALAQAALRLTSLRYLWVQGYNASETGTDLLGMVRPFWNIEFIPPTYRRVGEESIPEQPAQILAYYSLAGRRNDYPPSVFPLYPLQ